MIFKPTLADVARLVSDVLPSITITLKSLPRLIDKFRITETSIKPFHELIANDAECIKIQNLLNEEVTKCVEKVQNYMTTWEPFRDLWEVDKVRFIEKYKLNNPTATQFDSDNARYIEVANNVQIQDPTTHVHFLLIIVTDFKKSIIEHVLEWQTHLCNLLLEMTMAQIDDIYEYVNVKSVE